MSVECGIFNQLKLLKVVSGVSCRFVNNCDGTMCQQIGEGPAAHAGTPEDADQRAMLDQYSAAALLLEARNSSDYLIQ